KAIIIHPTMQDYKFRCGRSFFFSSRRRHTRFSRDWSSDVCSSDLEKLLLVLSPDGAIQSAHPLDKNRFPQPEGITFDEKGNMYISNEAADTDRATVVTFAYQNPQ